MDFKWKNRYSDTDEPDKYGRWARQCRCNGYMIANIQRNSDTYFISFFFPINKKSDTINYVRIGIQNTNLDNIKQFVERKFAEFIEKVTN